MMMRFKTSWMSHRNLRAVRNELWPFERSLALAPWTRSSFRAHLSIQQQSCYNFIVSFTGALRDEVLQFICTVLTYVQRYGTCNLSRRRVRFSCQENELNPGYIISAVERLIFRSRSGGYGSVDTKSSGSVGVRENSVDRKSFYCAIYQGFLASLKPIIVLIFARMFCNPTTHRSSTFPFP